MLTSFPVLFDSTEIPFTKGWDESSEVIENVNQTESGKDLVTIIRMDKLVISVDTTVVSDVAKTLKEFSKKNSFTVKRYDVLAEAYEERTMRIRNFRIGKLEKSERVRTGNGVWHVTFDLVEF